MTQPEVIVYTIPLCPYCSRAKQLLYGKGVEFKEIDVASDAQVREKMIQLAEGRTSVPQIFIGKVYVGGFDDLSALEERKELDKLLEK